MTGFDTHFPADSVEFCPHPDAQNIFVCGTYKLEQPQPLSAEPSSEVEITPPSPPSKPVRQNRKGKCLLFLIEEDSEEQFSLLQETSLPAILDMKWCHRTPSVPPILGIADSEGGITLHEWRGDENRLERIHSIACAPDHVLCLSLDWSNRRNPTTTLGSLVVSLSDGSLALLRPHDQSGLSVTDVWHAHDFEPWIAAWDYWNTNIVYSGGDDLKMKGWDVRQGFSQPTFVNKRFDAGVTTIQSHPHIENIIAVGSYDNTVRLFDTRKLTTPFIQADVGGGAWRVKWHPSATRQNDLLVACMHDGFKVVRFALGGALELPGSSSPDQTWEITKRFDEHESLAYGADWSFGEGCGDETLVASCSFYDHTLHLWKA
ncbi:Diphthine methyltransferase [Grifola frondosa]|uniref:methylated diphthine methylhydrolase n=1 Tax=Grifola frondosa TaxID=5627 RepID=A0A1C7MSF8_GRIFR|nr:Diphthine methyltransferase [Grifola frondosa]